MRKILFFIVLNLFFGICAAEEISVYHLEEGASSHPATIKDISWLAGYWEGKGFGGKVVQLISPASGSQMMGAFQAQTSEGDTTMYQFYTFVEKDDTVVLRMKHFSSDFTGWEEKSDYAEFPLVSVEHHAVYFDRLSFVETQPGRMEAAVDFKNGGIQRFYYEKVPLPH
ncbi:DUF6265 family protein [Parvularcula sp. IMCC14364]|uniref:DUF6265 family protein n=1 Tax=Parvularcula sp. IMCC14364 TaxID=3067902 RepID=UPI0027421DD8|nr:DUF6265 family protein [Parvularcula sp. IMCC14364]